MKNIYKIFALFLIAGVSLNSCETTDLDLTDNPNALTPEQADVNFFLNAIQLRYADLMESFGTTTAEVVRIEYMLGRDYLNAYPPTNFDGEWDDAYREILADVKAMQPIAEEDSQFRHIGIAQVLSADVLLTLVDMFGDVPYSEALQASEGNFNPNVDPGAEVYAAAEQLLDSAIVNLEREDASAGPAVDFYYDNNYENWVKLANTLKMKIYLQTRLVDASALDKFRDIVASGNYIDDISEDFQFRWGTNENQPDTRHPNYADNYTPSGAEDYLSNWLMGTMFEKQDPRIRYYFYRQTDAVPGEEIEPNEQLLTCSLEDAPQHYIDGGYSFCSLPGGYWGRDHGDDDGTPGDQFFITTYGVYPAGGSFDDNSFGDVAQGAGGQGAGITPLLLSSWVDFMQAEVALVSGEVEEAKAEVISGAAKSIEKVTSFASLDADADLSFEPTDEEINDYLQDIEARFEAGATEGKWNVLAEQFWIASFGNGILNYNFYRRTGYPTTLQPNRELNPGNFIRSFRYPANFVNNNSSVEPKQGVGNTVFWDVNPASPNFPQAN